MPKFTVETTTKHNPDEAYSKLKTLFNSDRDLRKLDSTFVCEFNDQQKTGHAKGSKFEAQMKVAGQGEGAKVQIDVNLPLMLTPVKGMVQSALQKKLDEVLG